VTAFRLEQGGAVDRGQTLAFTFDGRPFVGFEGDSIASALLASGVRVVGRSFKYHRPRGIWGAWTEEPNAIVDVTRSGRTTPNLRATTEALENDLAVRSVNALPSAAEDRVALIDKVSTFMPSGFYYKTFLWPRWETFEPTIRAMAGLGVIDPTNRPPADNPQFNARCDLLVVGAGPAGLAAAGAAAKSGQVVFLLEANSSIAAERSKAANGARGPRACAPRWKPTADASSPRRRRSASTTTISSRPGRVAPPARTPSGASGRDGSSSRPGRSSGR
jgi:sarcosine oxidase subunit alpha